MKKMNSYSHLLVRMTAVLVVVVIAAFVNHTDARARAESGEKDGLTALISVDDRQENGETDDLTEKGETAEKTDMEDAGNASTEEKADNDGKNDSGSTQSAESANASGKSSQTDSSGGADRTTDDPANITDVSQNDDSLLAGDGDDDYGSEGSGSDEELTDEEAARQKEAEEAARLEAYKQTQEYIDSLLVTSPEHYDAEVVARAKELPVASDNDRYLYITGYDKKIYKIGGMPEGFKNDAEARRKMVTVDVPVWKMKTNGEKYSSYWPLTIHEGLVDSIRCIFSDIYLLDIKFPFNYLSGYNYRKVGGVGLVNSKLMSTHAFGVALDINMGDYDNDYFLGKGNDLRNKKNPYCIPDEVIKIFEDYGWFWGGNYDICADTMHFQYFELGFLQYDSKEPFPILYRGAKKMDPKVIRNLSQRLVRLKYLEKETQSFSKKLDKVVKQFQEDHNLEPDGIVDYETWEPLINMTHDMVYVF